MTASDDYISHPGDMTQKARHLDRFARLNTERKRHTYELLHVGVGHRVLDIGCGVGADTLSLADIVGPTGHISGIDVDQAAVDEANRRAREAGVSRWVEHNAVAAAELPFADNSFDACHSERVFIHLLNPEPVFAQMVRVTKPGGWIAVIDADGGSLSMDTPESDIERRIVQYWARKHNNGYAGRQLYGIFKKHGMVDITVEIDPGRTHDFEMAAYLLKLDDMQERALSAGIVSAAEVKRFRSSLENASANGAFFGTFNTITVVGRKP